MLTRQPHFPCLEKGQVPDFRSAVPKFCQTVGKEAKTTCFVRQISRHWSFFVQSKRYSITALYDKGSPGTPVDKPLRKLARHWLWHEVCFSKPDWLLPLLVHGAFVLLLHSLTYKLLRRCYKSTKNYPLSPWTETKNS